MECNAMMGMASRLARVHSYLALRGFWFSLGLQEESPLGNEWLEVSFRTHPGWRWGEV